MSNEEIDMLPCPFCGFKQVEVCTGDDDHRRVYCYTCGSQGASNNNPVLAAESWNSRARVKE